MLQCNHKVNQYADASLPSDAFPFLDNFYPYYNHTFPQTDIVYPQAIWHFPRYHARQNIQFQDYHMRNEKHII